MANILFYGLFVIASVWVAPEPGPGFVRLTSETIRQGRTPAFFTAVGMFAGAVAYILLIASGLSWLVKTLPGLLTVLKTAGGLYLLWLAIDLLRKGKHRRAEQAADGAGAIVRRRGARSKSLLGGFVLVVLNPRTFLFYSAFLPLFLRSDIASPASIQLLFLGFGVNTIFLVVDSIFVFTLSRYGEKFLRGGLARTVSRYVGATVLSLFGLRLLLGRN